MMGGFTFNSSSISTKYSRLTLTVSGVFFLAEHGHILRILKDLIEDKSKANFLAKGLSLTGILDDYPMHCEKARAFVIITS